MCTAQYNNDSDCLISDQLLSILYGIGLLAAIAYIIVGSLQGFVTSGTVVFLIAYAIISGLAVFKKISITECPSKVLVIGILYTLFMYYINT